MRRDDAARSTVGGDAAIACSAASVGLGRGHHVRHVLRSVDLAVAPGERVTVVGQSGTGKTTLLDLVCGFVDPGEGTVSVLGRSDAQGRLSQCAMMPQHDELLPWLSLQDNAALPLRFAGLGRKESRARLAPLLGALGLTDHASAKPWQSSGGIRQRASFVRTVSAGKPIMLLDEPFGALDALTRRTAQTWLSSWLGEHVSTVLLVTHDVEEALLLGDRVLLLGPPVPGAASQVLEWFSGFASQTSTEPTERLVGREDFVMTRRRIVAALQIAGQQSAGQQGTGR